MNGIQVAEGMGQGDRFRLRPAREVMPPALRRSGTAHFAGAGSG